MAQFQIVDDFTFEVCLLPKEKALSFADYLNSIKVRAIAKQGMADKYYIYVTNELDVSKAKRELLRWAQSPFDKSFNKASWERGETLKSSKEIKSRFYLPLAFDLTSVTTIVEIICVVVYLLSFVFEDFVYEYLALSKADVFTDIFSYYKLITPSFVHFGLMHIAFNLVMFEAIGRPIERSFGIKKYLPLIFSIAIISNVVQYCFMLNDMAVFGGLSGVVYGVIGYSGVISRRDDLPLSFVFQKGLLTVSVLFILLGFFIDGIANLCHLGGLVVGIIWGLWDLRKKTLS